MRLRRSGPIEPRDTTSHIAHNPPMRSLALLTIPLAFLLVSCSDDPEPASEPTATATAEPESNPTEEDVAEGEDTQECQVAAVTWADRTADHVLNMSTTGPAFGEREDLEDLDDLISEISVICSPALIETVNQAMVPLTEANYELSLCAFDGECDGPASRKVRDLAGETASYVGLVRDLATE